jgi:nucleoside-diphosphate-sugar epimerase
MEQGLMMILVTGATGRVGSEVVRQGLARGDTVVALARHPENLGLDDAELLKVAGDVRNGDTVIPLLDGVDAVIHVVGIGSSKEPTTIYSEGARTLIEGMERYGVKRLVALSAQAANSPEHLTFVQRTIMQPVLQRLFGATYDDMRRMQTVLQESEVDWTQVRAPYISGKPAKGEYRLSVGEALPRYRNITAGDMATALLDIAEKTGLGCKDVFVAN